MNDHDLLIRIDQTLSDLYPRIVCLERKVDELRQWKAKLIGIAIAFSVLSSVIVEIIWKVLK